MLFLFIMLVISAMLIFMSLIVYNATFILSSMINSLFIAIITFVLVFMSIALL